MLRDHVLVLISLAVWGLGEGMFITQSLLITAYSIVLWRGTGIRWFGPGCFRVRGYELAHPAVIAIVPALAPPERIALALGTGQTAVELVSITGPLLAG